MARIFLLEDEPALRAMLCRVLASAGHDVLDADAPTTACSLVSLFGAEIVIADVVLRDQDSLETLADLRRSVPDLPLIVTSGGDPVELGERLDRSGLRRGVWLLPKPFSTGELLGLVKEAAAG